MLTPLERYLKNITHLPDGCWLWKARVNKVGYSTFKVNGKEVYGHRWAYEHYKGKIPDGFQIDHLCREKRCVNPDHLEAVTQRENLMRGQGICAQNARKIECMRGHNEWGVKIVKGVETRKCLACARKKKHP